MTTLSDAELYAFFFALHEHDNGERSIAGLEIDADFTRALKQYQQHHKSNPVRPERELTTDRVKKLLKDAKGSPDLLSHLVEDGPTAKRPKTAEEIHQEELAEQARIERLVRKFYVSGPLALLFFMAAIGVTIWDAGYRHDRTENDQGATLTSGVESTFDPVLAAILGLVIVASWCAVEAWLVAKVLWFDGERVKAAVPVIGKAWAERSKRKKREAEKSS